MQNHDMKYYPLSRLRFVRKSIHVEILRKVFEHCDERFLAQTAINFIANE